MSNTDKLREIKNQVALSKGYPEWKTMENFIIDHNYPVVVAQLLMSAMDEVTALISEHYVSKKAYDTVKEHYQGALHANNIEKDYIDKYYYPKEFTQWCVNEVSGNKDRNYGYSYMIWVDGEGIGFNNFEDVFDYWKENEQ